MSSSNESETGGDQDPPCDGDICLDLKINGVTLRSKGRTALLLTLLGIAAALFAGNGVL